VCAWCAYVLGFIVRACVRVCSCHNVSVISTQFRNQYDSDVTIWSPQVGDVLHSLCIPRPHLALKRSALGVVLGLRLYITCSETASL